MRRWLNHKLRSIVATDRRVWVASFFFFAIMTWAWAMAMPYFSGPDEPSHIARAWSLAHGEVLGRNPEFGGVRIVSVPEWLRSDHVSTECYRLDANIPAGCYSLFPSSTEVETPTTAGAQLPFYYLPVGLPFLVADGGPGLLLARFVAGAIVAAFIASTMVTARASRAHLWLPQALVLACPPMAIYISSVMNPSGVEIAASLALWTSGLVLVSEKEVNRRVVLRFGVALCALVLARQLGPLWVAIAIVTLSLLAGRSRLLELMKERSLQIVALAAMLAGTFWAGWILVARPLATEASGSATEMRTIDIFRVQVGRLWQLTEESVGVFGYLDVRLPTYTYVVWVSAVVFLLALCLLFGQPRYAVGAIGLLLGTVIVQMVGEFRSVATIGFFWQGRYSLPMLVGVPLVAAVGISRGKPLPDSSRLGRLFLSAAIWIAFLAAFLQSVRRYTVGVSGPLAFWSHEDWSPPLPSVFLIGIFSLAAGGWVLVSQLGSRNWGLDSSEFPAAAEGNSSVGSL